MSKKYSSLAKEILEKVGGVENVDQLTHCMTRLRFTLKDRSKVDAETVKKVDGVIDIIEKGGQFQVVIGTHVGEVFEEMPTFGGGDNSSSKPTTKNKWYSKALDMIAGSFTPIVPALAGAGMIRVLLVLLTTFGWLSTDSQTYYILNYVGDTAFYFLPFLLAYSASLKFKTSTVLSLLMAGIMLHPSLDALRNQNVDVSFLGIPVKMVYYSSSVIPILLTVWLQSYVEKFAKKISPNAVKVFLYPMITILILTPATLCVLGPLGGIFGDYMAAFFSWLNNVGPWIAPMLMGLLQPVFVMTGMHYSFAPIGIAEFVEFGYGTFITVGAVASNLALGTAAIVVALRTKDKNMKQIASSSGITGLMGITEPALYGVNLPLKYPLFAAMIGGGVAGLYAGLMGVKNYAGGNTGLFAFPLFIGGEGFSNLFHGCIMMAISIVVTFVLTFIFAGIVDKKTKK